MNEILISFETAVLAKEKGLHQNSFDYNIDTYYNRIGNQILTEGDIPEKATCCISQSLLQKWLRDIHNIHISIDLSSDEELKTLIPFSYEAIIYYNSEIIVVRHFFDTYEEALEEALKQSLKLIK